MLPSVQLEKPRDLLIFSCYSGIAFSNLMALREEHITEGIDGRPWVVLHRQKTGSRSTVPLLPKAREILQCYRGGVQVPRVTAYIFTL